MIRNTLSVVMPNYNHAKYIGEALESILTQSFKPLEVIVIDDASTDNSVEIIQDFVKRYPIVRLIRNEKNIGAINCTHKLIALAKGEYFYGLAADDKILPGFLEKSMNILIKHPEAGLCSTLSWVIDEEGRHRGILPDLKISDKECFVSPEKALSVLSKEGRWIMGNTAVYKLSALVDSGGYIPELRSFCDGFIHQVISLKYGVCYIPEPLACWRRMESGYAVSTNRNPDIMKEVIQHAVFLMRTTYKDIFPEKYVRNFERMEFFFTHFHLISSLQSRVLDHIETHMPSKAFSQKTVLLACKLTSRFLVMNFVLYCYIYFKPRIFLMAVRRLCKLLFFR